VYLVHPHAQGAAAVHKNVCAVLTAVCVCAHEVQILKDSVLYAVCS